MAIKRAYKEQKDIPAALASLYVEKNGEWVLELEGGGGGNDNADAAKLAEFRSTNIALKQELEALRAKYEGVDPEEMRKLAAEKKRLEEEAQIKAGEIDKVIAARVTAVKGELEKQLTVATAERDTLMARLSTIQIDQAVVTEAGKRGLRATAGPDIMARARSVFRLVNGAPVAFESDGKTGRVGKDGVTPLTVSEWIEGQVSEAPHLFEGNAGGGAAGGGTGNGARGGAGTLRNPFRKETWNLTEQMRLQKTDPGLAARLRSAANQ